jgi:hypothetical protein
MMAEWTVPCHHLSAGEVIHLVYYVEHYVVDILPASSPRLLSRGRAQRASGVSD